MLKKIEAKVVTNAKDYKDCLAIREAVFVIEQGVPRDLEIDQFEDQSIHFIAYSAGAPAGAGRLRVKDTFIKFERIATLKSYRGQGIGKVLMQEMERVATTKHQSLTPYMHAQLTAASFYEQLGWQRTGPIFAEAGIEHVAMVKPHLS